MKNRMSWRFDWMLAALALVCFGVAKSVLPYFEKLSAISEGFDSQGEGDGQIGEKVLLVLAVLLALAFFLRMGFRIFGKIPPAEE